MSPQGCWRPPDEGRVGPLIDFVVCFASLLSVSLLLSVRPLFLSTSVFLSVYSFCLVFLSVLSYLCSRPFLILFLPFFLFCLSPLSPPSPLPKGHLLIAWQATVPGRPRRCHAMCWWAYLQTCKHACLMVCWLGRMPSGVYGKPSEKRGQTQSSRGGHGRSRRFGFMRALAVTWLRVCCQFSFFWKAQLKLSKII